MAYNPALYFPQNYPYQQYQPQPQMQPQTFTPPTIRAEIVQVDSEEAAAQYPVGVGASQMMIAKDDSAIFIKTASQSGTTLTVYTKRPATPPAPVFRPEEYVRKDEVEKLVAAILSAREGEE